jgi:formylglycine-generating enzyme required for sulfatase activity
MPPPAPESPVTVAGAPFTDLDADAQSRKSAKAAVAPAPARRLWWVAGGALVGSVGLVLVSGLCAGLLVLASWGRNAPTSREAILVSVSTVHADEATGKEGSLPVVSIKEPGPTQPRPALAEPKELEPTPPPPGVPEPKQPEPAPSPSPAKEFTNALGMKFVRLPHGTFWMGDRGKQRQAEIPRDFSIGCYLVTQEQWQAIMGSNPSYFARQGGGADKVKGISAADLKQFPVEEVSWDDVQDFLKRLNAREKNRGFLYRLPTEAEWEYACRGGATSQQDCAFDFYLAQATNDLSSAQANFDGNYPAGNAPKGKYLERPTKVGSYEPNRLGLYDMHGNVWEWCEDSYDGGSARVVRGGSWDRNGSRCRASYRGTHEPANRYRALGVRLAAVPSGE